jgi:integrase
VRLTHWGIEQMITRCKLAGVAHIHPHQFRHTANDWTAAGPRAT